MNKEAKPAAKPKVKPHGQSAKPGDPVSTLRTAKPPRLARNVWIFGFDAERIRLATEVLEGVGHKVKSSESSNELSQNLREFRPDLIVLDMQDHPERVRHAGAQFRADRATRQLPIVMVGLATKEESDKADKQVTGPTRRYVLPLDAPTVLNAVLVELQ